LDDHHKHLTIIRIFGCARNEINEDEFAAFLGECYRNSAEAAGIDIDARRPHLVSSTPWKDDGRTWHTDPDRERKRRKPVWEPEALTWVMDLVDTMGDGEVRWDSRGSVSYAPKGKSYWLRVGTDDWKSFRMTFRTPKGSFDGQKLRKALAIPPFDDVETVPFGGDSSRVRMNGRGKDWTRVEIQGCLKSEIDTPAFCDFLRECHDRFIGAASVD